MFGECGGGAFASVTPAASVKSMHLTSDIGLARTAMQLFNNTSEDTMTQPNKQMFLRAHMVSILEI